ncbi:hypothetical protein [Psychrobacter sp. I-STPA6b]|uniref:hypothetical protein n=1 Tax=Psychrobacter sp. I-STPA6b TaxID=2585718 RepID=UPI001D0C1B7A|nr:hypothetical protein [Psychrobacter sp. I-STPA6b]
MSQSESTKPVEESGGVAGFPPLAITRIKEAQKLNRIAIYLVCLALACFVFFGTLASVQYFHDSDLLYQLFHYLPYALVGLSVPLTLYDAFIIYRYRLNQPSILILSIGIALSLLLICLLFQLVDWLWLGIVAWIGVAFLFQANFKRFFKFIYEQT